MQRAIRGIVILAMLSVSVGMIGCKGDIVDPPDPCLTALTLKSPAAGTTYSVGDTIHFEFCYPADFSGSFGFKAFSGCGKTDIGQLTTSGTLTKPATTFDYVIPASWAGQSIQVLLYNYTDETQNDDISCLTIN